MISEKNRLNIQNNCGRKEDLVAYLYGEGDVAERASFERHLGDCDVCRNELTAFGRVRDELSAWQAPLAPRSEIILRRSRLDLLRELIGMFPVWGRGAILAGAAAAMLLIALSIAGTSVSVKNGGFAVNFGGNGNSASGAPAGAPEEIEKMVQNAVAREREKIEQQYSAQLASFKDQLSADHEAKLKILQAGLKREIQKSNRQNASIRSFFAMDDSNDPWGDVR